MSEHDNDLLLIIDVQNDFCGGGNLEVPDGDAVVPAINALCQRFPHRVLTQDWHPAGHASFASSHAGRNPFEVIEVSYGPQVLWPDHCVQASVGAEFHPDLEVSGAEMIVRKGYREEIDSYSAFFENDHATPTGLAGYLRERGFKRLYMAGLATDYCVAYSALDARKLGFEVIVIDDACRAIDLEGSLGAALRQFEESGVELVTSHAV